MHRVFNEFQLTRTCVKIMIAEMGTFRKVAVGGFNQGAAADMKDKLASVNTMIEGGGMVGTSEAKSPPKPSQLLAAAHLENAKAEAIFAETAKENAATKAAATAALVTHREHEHQFKKARVQKEDDHRQSDRGDRKVERAEDRGDKKEERAADREEREADRKERAEIRAQDAKDRDADRVARAAENKALMELMLKALGNKN
jgi:hypothetical protein